MLYFAYGSNMDIKQIMERCPDAEVVGIGCLTDHALCFPRWSDWRDCGVSSVEPRIGHLTWGVVYRLSAEDLARLDKMEDYQEGRPPHENSYNRVPVTVMIGDEPTEVMMYMAVPEASPSLPNAAYLRHLRDGARHHGLPETYLEFLEGLEQE